MRSAGLFILLAFVLGLWIGLNPDARARAQATLKEADVQLADLGQQLKAAVNQAFHQVSEDSPPPSNPPVQPERGNFLGKLQLAIQQLWEGIKQAWNELITTGPRSSRPTQP